jgi:DNA-binding response OmpR family regulator
MRILIVEDNEATAETLTKLLKRANGTLEIFHVGTLAEGLKQSVKLKADVTLLDLCLPDAKDWRETARAIDKFHPPVIVITDLDGAEVIAECHKHGAQQVFQKQIALRFISALLSAMTSAKMRTVAAEQKAAANA